MSTAIPPHKRLEVVKLYFEGLSYDDIVEKTGVAKGTVAAIVEALKVGEFPQFEHVADMVNELRDLTVGLRKAGVGITEAAPLLILVKKLLGLGVEPPHLESWVRMCRAVPEREFSRSLIIQAASKLAKLEQEGLTYDQTMESLTTSSVDLKRLEGELAELRAEEAKLHGTREWHFFGKEREKRLVITPESMLVEFKTYGSFEELQSHFLNISDGLFSSFGELQIKRLGLRYINNIQVPGQNLFSWNTYLNRNLLCILNVPADKSKIARALHNLELNMGDFIIRFQYGMHNPDYPAAIRKKVFILDYDAYTTGLLAKEEIHQTLPIFHDQIEQLFETSIKDRLREIMNA